MSNPYESPGGESSFSGDPGLPLPPGQDPGLIKHVRVVAVMMMVQGALDLLAGLGLAGGAIYLAMTGAQLFQGPQFQQQGGLDPDTMAKIMVATYAGMGAAMIVIGVLTLLGGIRSWNFKGRVLSILALCSGMLTIFFCYCLPTSIALLIYGLIVFLNAPVAAAFEMAKQGYTREQILKTFSPPSQQGPFL